MRTAVSSLLSCLTAAMISGAAAAAPPSPAAAPKADPSASRVSGSENYVPTFGLNASISRGFGIRGVLAVDAGLDVPDKKMRERVIALKPRIVNGMRDAVLNYASQSYIVGERPDADILRARMQKSVDGILGPKGATVTLASVIIFDK